MIRRIVAKIAFLMSFLHICNIIPMIDSQTNRTLRCSKDSIKTAAQLRLAFEKASTNMTGPPTVIEVCRKKMVVTWSYLTPKQQQQQLTTDDVSTLAKVNKKRDRFAFKVLKKNVDLRCKLLKKLCTIEANNTGLFNFNNSVVNVTGFNFTNGGSVNHTCGGAIYVFNSTLNVSDTLFTNSTAQRGAAICSEVPPYVPSVTQRFDFASIAERSNAVPKYQNRIILNGSRKTTNRNTTTVKHIDFIKNSAKNGGALYLSNTWMSGTNVRFLANEASRNGGAIQLNNDCTLQITDSYFYSNYASDAGGAIFTKNDGKVTINSTTFRSNAAQLHSPAIDVTGDYRVEVLNSKILENTVNVTRQTRFKEPNIRGSLDSAAAVRSLSPDGILFVNTTFSDNTRAPLNEISNINIDNAGVVSCTGITFCDARGLEIDCIDKAKCTNCNRPRSSTVIEPGEGKCLFNETAPPTFTSLTLAPTFNAPTKTPTKAPTKAPIKARRCFTTREKLFEVKSWYLLRQCCGYTDFDERYKEVYGDPIGTWCVGAVKDFSYLFCYADDKNGCEYVTGIFNEDISMWNTSSATTMKGMFKNSPFNKNISGWDVSSVRNMEEMFWDATSFNRDISNWNVSSVTTMYSMFNLATSFNGDISNWNVSSVTNMRSMFYKATSFNQDISNWNVSSVTNMRSMFNEATSFNQDISNWNVSSVTDMDYMFHNATSFNRDISKWDVSSVSYMRSMFHDATSFNRDISNWNVSSVTDMYFMFYGASAFNQNLCAWGTISDPGVYNPDIFNGTNCPTEQDPDYSQSPPGPFCYNC